MRRTFLLLSVVCIIIFSSCTVIQEMQVDYDRSVEFAKEFCITLLNDDLEQAKEYLHPYSAPNKDRLTDFILKLEESNDISFSDGIEIKNTTFKKMAKFDNIYGGSVYSFQFDMSIGDKETTMFFEVVDNDIGYGIFYFGIIE